MSRQELDDLRMKFEQGVNLARKKLIEKLKKEDGELVMVKDGKIVRVKAREL